VIPVLAEANLSMRLAPGQRVEEAATELERLLRESAPAGADVEVELWSSAPPGLIPPDSAAIRLGGCSSSTSRSASPRQGSCSVRWPRCGPDLV
jgi:hypothetical protein